jgi:hypothetical protein
MAVIATAGIAAVLWLPAAAQDKSDNKSQSKPAETREARTEPRPLAFYRLDFTITELEDSKKVNARNYSTLLEAAGRGSRGFLKVGSRVPVTDGKGSFSYMDVGVNMDMYHMQERDGLFMFEMSGDVSSVASAEQAPQGMPPVLRQARFGGPSVVTPGKTTVLYTLDDVNSKHRFQIELVATKLK